MQRLHPDFVALFAKRPQVIKPGLARIEAALAALGDEGGRLKRRPAVLIGGTNGKGTTAAFLWRLLTAAGWRVGLFTSPHLVRFAERIQVSRSTEPVSDELLRTELLRLRRDLPVAIYDELSFFEVNTLLALRVFAGQATDFDVIEVGLGGRWDATNVTEPLLSIITSIGLDHQEFLGNTTAMIASEKAGIMRHGRPTLWGGPQAGSADAAATIHAEAQTRGAVLWEQGREFAVDGEFVRVRLPSRPGVGAAMPDAAVPWPSFLRHNYALGFAAACYLLGARQGGAEMIQRAVTGFGATPPPPCARGRFDFVEIGEAGKPQRLLLDVCHNVDGARALVRGLRETGALQPGQTLPALISILGDKDFDAVLDELRPALAPIQLFASTSERSWTSAAVGDRHRDLPFHANFATAWAAAVPSGTGKVPPASNAPTVVCGSVYAVGEVCAALGILK